MTPREVLPPHKLRQMQDGIGTRKSGRPPIVQAPPGGFGPDHERKLTESLSVERTLRDMEARGIAPTRENFIRQTTGGRPQDWNMEHEAELPEHLQDWDAFQHGPYNHHD